MQNSQKLETPTSQNIHRNPQKFTTVEYATLFCCHQTANNSKHDILYLYFRSEFRCKHKVIL